MKTPLPDSRASILLAEQRRKMARSAHAYVRGSTVQFYRWLEAGGHALPEGPPVWICGDCHVGNLGPLADAKGEVTVQIRDLDQTVIGNPAHDIIRLGLSLASAARGSDLPGVATAHIVEHLMDGYETPFEGAGEKEEDAWQDAPEPVTAVLAEAMKRRWRHLALERLDGVRPKLPLGRRFWAVTPQERSEMEALVKSAEFRKLVTHLKSRDDDAKVELADMAYWVKGCSSLGRLRYALLVDIKQRGQKPEVALIDIKEAVHASAPRAQDTADLAVPANSAARVVMGARALSPALGNRMIAAEFQDRSVFIRELLPQDLKIEIERLSRKQACKAARYLGRIVGIAHARQMSAADRRAWHHTLKQQRTSDLDAPFWLWNSIVALMGAHEQAYLDHCRHFALAAD